MLRCRGLLLNGGRGLGETVTAGACWVTVVRLVRVTVGATLADPPPALPMLTPKTSPSRPDPIPMNGLDFHYAVVFFFEHVCSSSLSTSA